MEDNMNYLDDDHYIQLPLRLVRLLGFSKAVMLRLIHSWVKSNAKRPQMEATHFKMGHWWTYNSYQEWEAELDGALPAKTMERTLVDLEELSLIRSMQFNLVQDRSR
jgi:hypothetical protein